MLFGKPQSVVKLPDIHPAVKHNLADNQRNDSVTFKNEQIIKSKLGKHAQKMDWLNGYIIKHQKNTKILMDRNHLKKDDKKEEI